MFTADPIQPKVEFAFGEQPTEFRDRDIGKKIGVVGAGDVWIKFILPQVAQRGGDIYITDLKLDGIKEKILAADVPEERIHIVPSIEEMPKDLHHIYLLTPPKSHVKLLKKIAAELPGVAIGIEKPIVASRDDAKAMADFIQSHNIPVYGIDWTILNGQPLLKACGLPVPYDDALEIEGGENLKLFNFKQISKIDARNIEGGGNSLGDPSTVAKNRGWLLNFNDGGGVAWDMIVHPVNLIEEMGLHADSVKEALLGSVTDETGVYAQFGREEGAVKTGELYARASMQLTRHKGTGNSNIETVMEGGKNGRINQQYIELVDDKGYVLHWEIMPKGKDGQRIMGSELTMFDPNGKAIARIGMKTDAYSMVADEFSHFADQVKSGGVITVNNHMAAHLAGVETIVAIHERARSEFIAPGTKVRQLALA